MFIQSFGFASVVTVRIVSVSGLNACHLCETWTLEDVAALSHCKCQGLRFRVCLILVEPCLPLGQFRTHQKHHQSAQHPN